MLDSSGETAAQPCAHIGDGRVAVLTGMTVGAGVAVDAELTDHGIPRHLGRAADTDDPVLFWSRWTGWEVVAKLTDQPMVGLVRSGVLRTHPRHRDVHVALGARNGLTVALGWRCDSATMLGQLALDRVHDPLAPATVHSVPPSLRQLGQPARCTDQLSQRGHG